FGLAILLIFKYSGSTEEGVFLAGVFLATFLIFIYDFRFLIIPDVLVAAGLIWVLAAKFWFFRGNIKNDFLTGLAIFIFFFLMHRFSKGKWVGGGDAKLGFLLGLWLGWPLGFLGLFAAYITGAVVGIGLILFKKVTFKSQIPFGPFLITGAWLAYIWGYRILELYGI
ncbi:MAG: prepilin peptidase, partial [Parcubacteria group bacterium]|nr:prepilin peptidase [Parcubacteria group bacterium]